MAVEIIMPRLSDSMEEGTILQWFVAEGDAVAEGEPLVEVETDKASVTYESEHDGTVLTISAHTGDSVAVGAVIAVVGAPGEQAPAAGVAAVVGAPGEQAPAAGVAAVVGAPDEQAAAAARVAAVPSQATTAVGAGADSAPPATSTGPSGRVKASPLARRIASELGVDLAALVGSGPQGRVIRADVERSAAAGAPAPAPAAPAAAPAAAAVDNGSAAGAKGEPTREALTRLQQTIARRMAQSRATVPDFELRVEVDMSAAVALREELRGVTERPPSYNDLIVKAAALALREFPRVNGAYRDGAFERYPRVNVGIAVAAEDALVVPTIFDADTKSIGEIATASRALAAKVRDGSVTPAELSGSTFSVSNLGMYGIDSFSAVIDAPQAAILAVGSLKLRPGVDESGADGPAIVARPTIQLSLACDHRILYGADGARFLARIRELLERPMALLL